MLKRQAVELLGINRIDDKAAVQQQVNHWTMWDLNRYGHMARLG